MARVLRGVALVVLLLGPAARLRAQSAPSGSPFDYALFGLSQTRLGPGEEVFSGDVRANVGTVTIGAGARVGGNVAAFSIRLAQGARVARRLFCLFLDGATSTQCRAAVTVPLVAPAAAFTWVGTRGCSSPVAPTRCARCASGGTPSSCAPRPAASPCSTRCGSERGRN